MGQNVLADAQFTLAAVLRPFDGFEFVYQGQDIFKPIAFPGVLDDDAGKPGFSPYLLKGLQVPMGAKMQLWFPAVVGLLESGFPALDYKYELIWRLRNVGDFQRRQKPYHLSKESFGAPDTFLAGGPNANEPVDQFVLPAASETVLYQQPEPAASGGLTTFPGSGLGNLRSEFIAVPSDLLEALPSAGLPLLPPNAAPDFNNPFPVTVPPAPPATSVKPLGFFQQGVVDPRYSNTAPGALFRPYYTIAKGDELIVMAYRNNDPSGTLLWDFHTSDFQFSNLYGTNAFPPAGTTSHKPFPDLGIYVFAGSNPS